MDKRITDILLPYNDRQNDSSFFLYRQSSKQKFVCTDYQKLGYLLAERLYETNYNHDLLINWLSCETHPIIFDIDVKNYIGKNTFDCLMEYFNNIFLNVLQKHIPLSRFGIMLCMRRDFSGGMHIIVSDFEATHNLEITQDDYENLCNLMKNECHYKTNGMEIILDCFTSVCLIACDKLHSTGDLYIPIFQFKFEKYFCKDEEIWKVRKIDSLDQNKLNKMNAAFHMMPVSQKNATFLKYRTSITPFNDKCITKFKSCVNNRIYGFVKENVLVASKLEDNNKSFSLHFLKENAKFIDSFNSFGNKCLKTWYKKFSLKRVDIGIFQNINHKLRKICIHLKDEETPLKSLLVSNYSKPVFYALCNLMKDRYTPEIITDNIRKHFSISHKFPISLPKGSSRLNFDTILYSAYEISPKVTNREWSRVNFIGMGWDWIFKCTQSIQDIKDYMILVQKRHYPIVKTFKQVHFPLAQNAEMEKMYYWNPDIQIWILIEENKLKKTISNTYNMIKSEFIFHFEGYSNLPDNLRHEVERKSDWIDSIVNEIFLELKNSEAVENIHSTMSLKDVNIFYGCNVPQWYLFNFP